MNQTQIVITNNESFKNIRYAFIYSFELIIFIIFLELIIVASINTPFITPIKDVAIKEQEIRAIAVFFGYLFLTTSIAFIVNICLSKENSKLEKIFAIIGIIPFVNIANITYYFFSSFKEKKIISYIINIFSSTNSDRKICYKHVIKMIKNRNVKRDDCLFWNTFIFTLVFLISIVSLIFIILQLDPRANANDPRNLWWFRKFSYFTEWSNLSCFLVCTLFLLNHRWKIFNNGKLVNYSAIYILFVFLIYWMVLLPGSALINSNLSLTGRKISSIISTSWFHLVMPLAYLGFTAYYNYFVNNYKNINTRNYYKSILYIPLTYSLYVYTLPFIANLTVYGLMTNVNPNNTPFGDKHPGEYWHLIFIPSMLLAFCGLTWIFLKITEKINSKSNNLNSKSNN